MENKRKTVYLESFSPMRLQEGRGYQVNVNVDLADIEKQIRDVELGLGGDMGLEKGGYRLSIRSHPGKYLITMANNNDDIIATYWNKSVKQGQKVLLGGDYWGATDICTDVDQVVE